jgi:hypothetical protein
MGAILVALVLATVLHLDLRRSQLTSLRAELRQRGFKLTARELAESRQGLPTDLTGLAEADAELQKISGSRVDPHLSLMRFDASGGPLLVTKLDRPFSADSDRTLTNWTWEHLEQVMQSAQPPLQKARTLAHQDIPYYRIGQQASVFEVINLARWLESDAGVALRQGPRTAALDDLESLTDLALVGYGEKEMIVSIGRTAATHIGLRTACEITLAGEWTEPELKRIATAWERVWPLQAFETGVEGELRWADEMTSEMRKQVINAPWADRMAEMVGEFDSAEDERLLLEWPLAHWEAAKALERGQSWQSTRAGLEPLTLRDSAKIHSRWRHFGLRLFLAKIYEAFQNCVQSEAARQLLLADIAIQRFKLRHNGAVPRTLRELTPEFLSPTSGHDLFGAGDLKYRPNPDGTYLLYSVGMDGVDGGGDNSVTEDKVGGDKRRFWDSRDMVWPSAR